jgi:hypothetical protein
VLTREGQTGGGQQPAAARFWDADGGRLLRSFPMGRTVGVAGAYALSPDGKTLAVADDDSRDHSVGLWDLASGAELKALHGHTDSVRALAFAPDGKTLASGSDDTTVLLWDVSRARLDVVSRSLGRLRRAAEIEARVSGLLAALEDDQFEARERASRELEKLGPEAAPALRQALAGALSVEARSRARKALDALKPAASAPGPPGLPDVPTALAVLENVGTPEARRALEELARGPAGSAVTREARAALARLAKKGPGRKSP